ncbi:MAG TPA: alpha-E domain-containing protein [Pseudomonadales bacterium]
MLSSVAERVYWLGRYLERVENAARLINVYSQMLFDLPTGSHLGWGILIDITGCNADYDRLGLPMEEKQIVRYLVADPKNPASLLGSIHMMRENARTTREIIPADAWEHFNNLYLKMKETASQSLSRRGRQQLLEDVIGDCQRLFGLLAGSMNHDTAYAFIQIGRKVERADMTSRMVDVGSISLLPAFTRDTKERVILEPYENVIWMNVLRCLGGYQAYRQKVQHAVGGEEVVRFLLQDEEFPRAIGYCLKDMVTYLNKLPNNQDVLHAVARAKKVTTQADISSLLQRGLLDFIDELQISFADIHEELNNTWFMPMELRKARPAQSQSSDDGRQRQIQTI